MLGGGVTIYAPLGDHWKWDGTTWTQRTPATSPMPRVRHTMCYDFLRQRTVLCGGGTSTGLLADTWEWDGSTWIQRQSLPAPMGLIYATMSHDQARGRTVLIGGAHANSVSRPVFQSD